MNETCRTGDSKTEFINQVSIDKKCIINFGNVDKYRNPK